MSALVRALRELLEERHLNVSPLPQRFGGITTGIAALDQALPGPGLPRGRVLRLFDWLADLAVTLVGATGIAVGLLRRLAISPLGKSALGSVTTLLLDRVTTGRDLWEAVHLILGQVGATLRLLPQEYDVVRERVSAFAAAKGTSLD